MYVISSVKSKTKLIKVFLNVLGRDGVMYSSLSAFTVHDECVYGWKISSSRGEFLFYSVSGLERFISRPAICFYLASGLICVSNIFPISLLE